ncbi:hypothetical protein NQ315_007824 [Exocentrus adspersus]|uniref:Ammonium transporter AmtB-like domain-containing protein n=1 Tax=Exocentrus adspersus TaxID=1586481 RepID=A0AAV8W8I2_9CUCU|nr:hypothetical protein NQ315_007824 [Exocentrus adspersus]
MTGIEHIYRADIAAAAVLISMGAVLGRTSYIQLMVMAFIEIAAYAGNLYLGTKIFQAADAGGSIFVHTFGAYFGLAVSYVINRKKDGSEETRSPLLESNYTSDLFAILGTMFLWLFWPSFNAVELKGDDQHRAVINTYLALTSCCTSTFAASLILTPDRKFDMVHIQNSTLAGGVAVGASANLMLQPYGAVIIGIISGVVSVVGYSRITPYLEKRWSLQDTCGVHNLHGLPGVLGTVVSVVMAAVASEETYHQSLYETYPARASPTPAPTPDYHIAPGVGRGAGQQAGYQLISLLVTLAVAVASGFITGFVLKWSKIGQIPSESQYDDAIFWAMPEHAPAPVKKVTEAVSQYHNASFEVPVDG